jgi:hypothetical protein
LDEFETSDRRIWLRAFYGFDPEGSGYIGFTHAGDRQAMLDQMRTGDLVLIYGAIEDITDPDLRAQALGFLEVDLVSCVDKDRMSDEAHAWKRECGFEPRWTHGIVVRRAWRVRNRVHIRTIAPRAYDNRNRFRRTTRAILLDDEERNFALSHQVRQTNVFGEPGIAEGELDRGPMDTLLKPSRGITPTFGNRSVTYVDGENQLYLMLFSGEAQLLLGASAEGKGVALAKVGRSNDPVRRLAEINSGFPPSAVVGWKVVSKHKFPDGGTAHARETDLKAIFDRNFTAQGGEFFLGDRSAMIARFQEFCIANTHRILGAPAKAKGI